MTPKPDTVAVSEPKALTYGAFGLAADGIHVNGKADLGDWGKAVTTALLFEELSPKWIAQLVAYGQSREDWGDAIYQYLDSGRFTKKSLDTYGSVARKIGETGWVDGVSFSHHQAAAALEPGERRKLLQRAKREHLSALDVKREVRKTKARRIIKGQAGELAKLQNAIADHVHDAIEACREIMREDCKHAAKAIEKARHHLDGASVAVAKLKKAQGGAK